MTEDELTELMDKVITLAAEGSPGRAYLASKPITDLAKKGLRDPGQCYCCRESCQSGCRCHPSD